MAKCPPYRRDVFPIALRALLTGIQLAGESVVNAREMVSLHSFLLLWLSHA